MKSIWLLALAVCGCTPDAVFHCASSDQCRNGGTTGTCEGTGFCSFPDPSCASGARYTNAGSLSEQCVSGFSMGTDSDHDGVVDAVDNCPTIANPDQANEDGDKYGDACDPCPPYSDDVVTDTDGDGIDDRCDPHIGLADHLVMFEGFHHGLPTTWRISGGTWVAVGDSILGTPPAIGPSTVAILQMPYTASKSVQISAGLTPTEIETSAASAGVIGAYDGIHVLVCELHQLTSGQSFVASDTGVGTTNSKPWAFAAGTQYSVVATYDLQNAFCCYVENGTANTSTSINLAIAPAETERALGIYLDHMPVRVDWIMMIEQD